MTAYMFHVRHNARPALVQDILKILAGSENLTLDDVMKIGSERGYQIGTVVRSQQSIKENSIQALRDLRLVEANSLTLTTLGEDIVRLLQNKPGCWGDVMHALFYTLWNPSREAENCFSWSYRTACDRLWELGSTFLDRRQLVSFVSESAMAKFNTNRVSFSKDSMQGILQWIDQLQPPVLSGNNSNFNRRTFCPPETFSLAVDYLYCYEGVDYQTNLLLDTDKRDLICKFCLLDPGAFESVFDWASGQYPFLHRGSSGGWGTYILLARQPQIRDFLG